MGEDRVSAGEGRVITGEGRVTMGERHETDSFLSQACCQCVLVTDSKHPMRVCVSVHVLLVRETALGGMATTL